MSPMFVARVPLGAASRALPAAHRELDLARSGRSVTRAAAVMAAAAGLAACGGHGGGGSMDTIVPTAPLSIMDVDASCPVVVESWPLLSPDHVAIGSAIQWDSNPPSSGPHYPIWAAYQTYTSPVPRGYYVHDLEHGAIVFLYNCASSDCPDVVAALTAASNSLPDDPLCAADGEGVRVRTVITPDPLLDVPVAAASWGWTYKAQCPDIASLSAFAAAHYGQGRETLCANGTTVF